MRVQNAVLSVALLSLVFGQAFAGFDSECRLSAGDRQARLAAINARIGERESDLALARKSLADLEKIEHQVKIAYRASDIADGIGTAASIVAGGAIVKTIVTRSPLILFGNVISLGGALTMTGTRTALIGASVYVLFKGKSLDASELRLQIDGKELESSNIDDLLKLQFESAKSHPLIAPDMAFLNSPDCSGERCPMYQPQIAEMFETLNQWHDAGVKRAKALDAWWKPEEMTHLFGETITKLDIPYARNTIRLVNLELQYYHALKGVLERDAMSCNPGSALDLGLRAPGSVFDLRQDDSRDAVKSGPVCRIGEDDFPAGGSTAAK